MNGRCNKQEFVCAVVWLSQCSVLFLVAGPPPSLRVTTFPAPPPTPAASPVWWRRTRPRRTTTQAWWVKYPVCTQCVWDLLPDLLWPLLSVGEFVVSWHATQARLLHLQQLAGGQHQQQQHHQSRELPRWGGTERGTVAMQKWTTVLEVLYISC